MDDESEEEDEEEYEGIMGSSTVNPPDLDKMKSAPAYARGEDCKTAMPITPFRA